MDPEVIFWPSGFLEAWGTETKKLHAARPNNKRFLKQVSFFGLGTPVVKKTTKTLRDPFEDFILALTPGRAGPVQRLRILMQQHCPRASGA
jgi:hypothetical protein